MFYFPLSRVAPNYVKNTKSCIVLKNDFITSRKLFPSFCFTSQDILSMFVRWLFGCCLCYLCV